jgi:hypothetical protein
LGREQKRGRKRGRTENTEGGSGEKEEEEVADVMSLICSEEHRVSCIWDVDVLEPILN